MLLFTQPSILKEIGHARLAKLLNAFEQDLKSSNLSLPNPEALNGEYFSDLAALFARTDTLPTSLRNTLLLLEHAAAPENAAKIDKAIHRRIPRVGVSPTCPLDRVLELWFLVPDELSQFRPPTHTHTLTPPASASTSPGGEGQGEGELAIENQKSTKIKNPTDGQLLLDNLVAVLRSFVVLPKWAAETLALWVLHTYTFQCRDVCAYIGIESPEMRCGKTTLLAVLTRLVHSPLAAANISSSAFFRAIEELQPTLLIDETDTFLHANDEFRGILNAGCYRQTAFVMRVIHQPKTPSNNPTEPPLVATEPSSATDHASPITHHASEPPTTPPLPLATCHSPLATSRLMRFSCWCPKVMARIGRLPETLRDRCIVIRMERKTPQETCERLRKLDGAILSRQCARFAGDHAQAIATATPDLPDALNDRAADIWEPLLALADLAGGHWPALARQAATALSAGTQEHNPAASLLLDIFKVFAQAKIERIFTKTLVGVLNLNPDRPWAELLRKGKQIDDLWLARQLRPYGIKPRTIWIGNESAKGYSLDDFWEACRRYVPRAEFKSVLAEMKASLDAVPPDSAPESDGSPDAPDGST